MYFYVKDVNVKMRLKYFIVVLLLLVSCSSETGFEMSVKKHLKSGNLSDFKYDNWDEVVVFCPYARERDVVLKVKANVLQKCKIMSVVPETKILLVFMKNKEIYNCGYIARGLFRVDYEKCNQVYSRNHLNWKVE